MHDIEKLPPIKVVMSTGSSRLLVPPGGNSNDKIITPNVIPPNDTGTNPDQSEQGSTVKKRERRPSNAGLSDKKDKIRDSRRKSVNPAMILFVLCIYDCIAS
jgi:hypothetical protein